MKFRLCSTLDLEKTPVLRHPGDDASSCGADVNASRLP